MLTAIGNDYGFELVFERQVRGLGRRGDGLLAISTSGRSPNILAALRVARELGVTTIGFTGVDGGAMAELLRRLPFRTDTGNAPESSKFTSPRRTSFAISLNVRCSAIKPKTEVASKLAP